MRFEPSVPPRRVFNTIAESVPAFELPWGAMLDPWTRSRRKEALRPIRSALGGESGARSSAALRVWDGPSGFLWRETREKPDSDPDYGFCATGLEASGRFCSRLCGIHIADVRLFCSGCGKRSLRRSMLFSGPLGQCRPHRTDMRSSTEEYRRTEGTSNTPSAFRRRRRGSASPYAQGADAMDPTTELRASNLRPDDLQPALLETRLVFELEPVQRVVRRR